MTKRKSTAIPPDIGPLVDDWNDYDSTGWGQGALSDGRAWQATRYLNADGSTTIMLVIPALEDEHSEDLVKQVVAEGVIVPRVRNRLKYESEWYEECYRPEPTWMVEFVLSDAAGEWATPGFEVYDDDDYVEH